MAGQTLTRADLCEAVCEEVVLSRVDALQGLAMNTSQNRYAARISMGIEGWQEAQLLTDDFAPVEMAWDLMTIEFAK